MRMKKKLYVPNRLLIGKKREIVDEVWPQESYSWNQVPRESLIPAPSMQFVTDRLDIFLPHSTIQLQNTYDPGVSWGNFAI